MLSGLWVHKPLSLVKSLLPISMTDTGEAVCQVIVAILTTLLLTPVFCGHAVKRKKIIKHCVLSDFLRGLSRGAAVKCQGRSGTRALGHRIISCTKQNKQVMVGLDTDCNYFREESNVEMLSRDKKILVYRKPTSQGAISRRVLLSFHLDTGLEEVQLWRGILKLTSHHLKPKML